MVKPAITKELRIFLTVLFCIVSGFTFSQKSIDPLSFKLRNIDNSIITSETYPNAKGYILIFTCNHCPFAKLYTQRLNDLHDKYSKLGIPLLAINSMDTLVYEDESFSLMQAKAKNDKFHFPYLQDQLQLMANYFNAQHTPQAFLIWKSGENWKIKYSGAIDDNGENPLKAKSFIAAAADELLLNQEVSIPKTESFGCKIYFRK
jgi:hypothetical protein